MLIQDLRYGARMLLTKPGFTLVAVLTLALGIGANTAVFSVVNALLLRPLPYKDPTQLVAVESFNPQAGRNQRVSPADFWDWKEQSQTLELAAYLGTGVNLVGTDQIETVVGSRVSTNFFNTVGVYPLLGRVFVEEEGLSGSPRTVLFSHRFWQRRFGSDPSVVGSTIKTSEGPVTVIGVMPPTFRFPSYAEVWTPLERDSGEMTLRSSRYFQALARLRPNHSIEGAAAEMVSIARRLEEAHPRENENWSVELTPWREYLVRDSRRALLILMAGVGLMLLIACANVGNLLLVGAGARRKEMAIRVALGAGRWQLMRQLLTESLLLGIVGGAAGLLLAVWGIELILGLLPKSNWAFQSLTSVREEVNIDGTVLLFTLSISLLTSILFGLIPGLQGSRSGPADRLKEDAAGTERPQDRRARNTLVVLEIASALVLLVGAGLLTRSFVGLQRVDPGYDVQGLMTMSLPLPRQNTVLFVKQALDEVHSVPGVESVSLMSFFTFGGLNFPFNIEGRPLPAGDEPASYSAISSEYFGTLKAEVLSGRTFNALDTEKTPSVAIVNQTLARRYFPGEDPIGKRLEISYLGGRVSREVVGVVSDIKQGGPGDPTQPEIFVPFEQQPWFSGTFVIRSEGPDPLVLKNSVQQAIWSLNKNLPASRAETVEQTLSDHMAAPRLYTYLLGIFAIIAFVLAGVGIYGVMSYSVSQRSREIGIRIALGAQTRDVLKLVVGQGMRLAAIGLALGLIGAFGLTRLMSRLLFGVTATDPTTFAGIAVLLGSVALLACHLPARRAARVDPMTTLKGL